MKNRILLIGLGFLWACSGDPNQQGYQDRSPGLSEVQDAADSTRDDTIGDGTESGTQSETVASGDVTFNGGQDGRNVSHDELNAGGKGKGKGNGDVSELGNLGQVVEGSKNSGPGPSMEPAPEPEEGAVTPPHVVTGAYLVGTLLASEPGTPIKVGLMVKSEDRRLSLETGFETSWFMTAAPENASQLKLEKPKDSSYDRVLEFNGSLEEFAAIQDAIVMQVSVVDIETESGLSTVLVEKLSELFMD